MFDPNESDKTPILLHPAKRKELFVKGQNLFNEEQFFEAHEKWEALWRLEQGRDKSFIQALILVAGHFVHILKENWSGAQSLALLAKEKFRTPPAHSLYQEVDIIPLLSALDYNLELLTDPQPESKSLKSFIIPKVFQK